MVGRALLGLIILTLVIVFPAGIVGSLQSMVASLKSSRRSRQTNATSPVPAMEAKA